MWLNVDAIMGILDVSRATVYRMAKSKKIPAYRVGGRWKFKDDEVNEWLKNGGGVPLKK